MNSRAEQLASILAEAKNSYVPNAEVQAALSQSAFIAIVGPIAVGKSTVIEAVCELDPEFNDVKGFTTRDPRPGERAGEYREYWPHTEESLEEINRRRQAGELVQYTVHGNTGRVYASELIDYASSFNIMPTLPQGIAPLENLPFRQLMVMSLVCSPHEWRRRFNLRASGMEASDIHKRTVEACSNLKWSLEREDTIWIKSRQNKVDEAARKIIAVARGHDENTTNHRKTGEKLLHYIEGLH